MGFQQPKGKMSLALVIAMAVCIAQSSCKQTPWSETKPTCPKGSTEPYWFTKGGKFSNWCCTKQKDVMQFKEKGKGCQTSKCLSANWQKKRVAELVFTNTVDGVTQINKEAMRGDCTDEKGKKGEAFVMCPENSMANVLISLYGAEINEFPHMVKMFAPTNCGGTVYNSEFVLTAAHCVVDKTNGEVRPASAFKLLLGSNLGGMKQGENVYEVEEVICNENYTDLATSPFYEPGNTKQDTALLKLKTPIDFKKNPNIKALRIAPENFNPFDYMAPMSPQLGGGQRI